MKRQYFLFYLVTLLVYCTSCNKEWDTEQYQNYISFKAPINDNDVTPIHLPYKKGEVTYELPLIVSGSLKNNKNYHVHVALDPDTLRVFNYKNFQSRIDLYFKELPSQYYSFSDTVNIKSGNNTGLLDIKFSLQDIDLVDKWVLPLTVVDASSYDYVSNPRRHYNKALLRVMPFNDFSGTYSATSYKIYLKGNEDGSPIVKNFVDTYVVNDSTIFFYAGNIDEDRADRGNYKIYATFDREKRLVTFSTDNPFMEFNINETARFSVESINDALSPYLVHRYVKIDNIAYDFTDYTSNSNGTISYTVKGSLTMERKINTQIPDRDQAILW